MKQIFEHGFFHADPHPGNIRVLKDNVICFLDYGMMGSLSARHREDLADILIGIITKDVGKITKTSLKVPRDFYLLAKALVTIEGVGRELDP